MIIGLQQFRFKVELLSAVSIPAKHDSLRCTVTVGWRECSDFSKMSLDGLWCGGRGHKQ